MNRQPGVDLNIFVRNKLLGFTPGEIAAMVIVPLAVVLLVVLLIIFAMKGKAESSEYYAMDYS